MFTDIAAYHYAEVVLSDDTAKRIIGMRITSNLFSLVARFSSTGKLIRPDENQTGNLHVAVLSYAL